MTTHAVSDSREGSGIAATIYGAELGRLEAWVAKNSGWLALGIVGVAFAVRLAYSDSCYLNPDEALHFNAARPSSWLETYEASRLLAHPPLFILVLHGILFLGRTELILRLPSVVGGTVALWVAFAWMRRSLGEIPALAGLGLLAVSPAAISASTEVRQYGLLLCFVCGSLYATQRTFTGRSTTWAIAQGLFLLGALLTHYTAVLVIASLGLYVWVRSLLDGVPRRILFTFGVSQLVLATVLGWLYFGHVRSSIPVGAVGSMDYLQQYYYSRGRETPLGFAWRALSRTFAYGVGSRRLAFLFMLVFLAGLAALLKGRTKARGLVALLIISPFAVGIVAAASQVFPFAGTRHQTYLLPFLAAGMSASLGWVHRRMAVRLLLLGAVIAPLWVIVYAPTNDRRVMPMGDMTAAIEYVRRTVPLGAPLFVDYQTLEILKYYLARDDTSFDALHPRAGAEKWLGGYRVVMPSEHVYTFRPDEVLGELSESAQALGAPPDDPWWVVSVAWFQPSLASRLSAGRDRDAKEFGRVSVIKTPR